MLDKLRALEKDGAVDGKREPVGELDADDRAAKGSGITTWVSKSDAERRPNASVRYFKSSVKPSAAISGFFGVFHCHASERVLKPSDSDTIQRLKM